MKIRNTSKVIVESFAKEEYASVVYQILQDYDHVTYINMTPEEIECGVIVELK